MLQKLYPLYCAAAVEDRAAKPGFLFDVTGRKSILLPPGIDIADGGIPPPPHYNVIEYFQVYYMSRERHCWPAATRASSLLRCRANIRRSS